MAPVGTRGVLLRGHDYGDTSRILRFYTLNYGLLSVMARGVRGRSGKGSTTISTFATGDLTAYVKTGRDLHTMKDFSCTLAEKFSGGVYISLFCKIKISFSRYMHAYTCLNHI